jgi:nucleoside-diphosphate-sugar epimerase
MDLLVTGAGGFSGSHLVATLLARGHTITAIVGHSRGRLDPALQANPALTVVAGDLTGALPLPSRIDAIVHAAARSPSPGVTDTDMVRDNVVATARLLDYARATGAHTLIYLSSLSIYGDIAGPMVDETTPIVRPDVYGTTKYLGEVMLRDLPPPSRTMSIRLPGVLGRNSVRNWLTNVLAAAKDGREIACYNPQASFNNAIHINDLSRFVQHLMTDSEWTGHRAVTVGAADKTSIRQAVRIIVDTLGSRSAIRIHDEARPSFIISNERAQQYGYRPMGIESMLAQFASENRD